MNWMRERDALLAQTLAFVQSVAGRKEEARVVGSATEPVKPEIGAVKVQATPLAAEPMAGSRPSAPAPRPIVTSASDMRSEILARVASFRAHQERFTREREQYFSATLTKLRAAIDELPPRRPEK